MYCPSYSAVKYFIQPLSAKVEHWIIIHLQRKKKIRNKKIIFAYDLVQTKLYVQNIVECNVSSLEALSFSSMFRRNHITLQPYYC